MAKNHNASKPSTLRRCDKDRGKRIYARRKQALSAAATSRSRTTDKNINVYKCRFASHFHIGHDHFNKDQKPNFNNSTLANRKVAEVSSVPARPAVSRPVYKSEPPATLTGSVIRKMTLERKQ